MAKRDLMAKCDPIDLCMAKHDYYMAERDLVDLCMAKRDLIDLCMAKRDLIGLHVHG